MPQDYENPFDRPLNSELQEHQAAQVATQNSSPIGNPFDEPLLSEKLEAQAAQAGRITNDVGNTVIVPSDGESFADTMKRAAAYGQTVTQDQVNKELATAPKKAAEVVAAAPTIGAVGTGALSGLGELLVNSPEIARATIKHLMEPGTIFKFPAGRAVEYYLAGKLGLSKAHLGDVAKMVP